MSQSSTTAVSCDDSSGENDVAAADPFILPATDRGIRVQDNADDSRDDSTDPFLPLQDPDSGNKVQHHAGQNDDTTERGGCCLKQGLQLTNMEERLMRLQEAEGLAEKEGQSVTRSQDREDVFIVEGLNPLDLRLVRLEDSKDGRPRWKLQGASRSNKDDFGQFVDSETLSKIIGKKECRWTPEQMGEVLCWLRRRELELYNVIKTLYAKERDARCCTGFYRTISQDNLTAPFCWCMPWGGSDDNTELGCCFLKQRLPTDVERRLMRLHEAEMSLREGQKQENQENDKGQSVAERQESDIFHSFAQSQESDESVEYQSAAESQESEEYQSVAENQESEKEQSVVESHEIKDVVMRQAYNPLDFQLLKLETGKWKVKGTSGSYSGTDGLLVQINSAALSAILNSKESLWTFKQRSDVLDWLQKREKDIKKVTRNLDFKERDSCFCRTIFEDKFTAPCCCCLSWGIFYKDSSHYDDNMLGFQWWDVLVGVFGIGLYVLDVVTDLWMAYTLFKQGELTYFRLTVAFVFLAYVVNAGMALNTHKKKEDFKGKQWIPVIVGVIFNAGSCITTAVYLYYGCKSRQRGLTYSERWDYEVKTKNCREASCLLRLVEGCLEAAPQLVFQLYLLVLMPEIHGTEGVMRVLSVVSSWFSLSLTLTTFNRAKCFNRNIEIDKYGAIVNTDASNLLYMTFECFWRMAETGGRVLSIAVFTSVFHYWVLAFLVPHFVIMTLWYYRKDKRDPSIQERVADLLLAYLSLFAFWPRGRILENALVLNTRIRYLVFYALFHGENVAMLLLWYLHAVGPGDWMRPWGLGMGLAFLPLHLLLLVLSYRFCHRRSRYIWGKGQGLWCDAYVWRLELWDVEYVKPRQT